MRMPNARTLVTVLALSCLGVGCADRIDQGRDWRMAGPDMGTDPDSDRPEASPTSRPRIAAGYRHTCAAAVTGRVYCWGAAESGRLGAGREITESGRIGPVAVPGLRTATTVAAGYRHSCAVLADGSIRCWGHNGFGQLGNDKPDAQVQTNVPVQVEEIGAAVGISAGKRHTCAIAADGELWCWGQNNSGVLGIGQPEHEVSRRTVPTRVAGIDSVIAVSAGNNHTCAVSDDGRVYCWGHNFSGQIGDGNEGEQASPRIRPHPVPGLRAVAVATGQFFSCAALTDGSVKCWGENACRNAICPSDAATNSTTPTAIPGIDTAVDVASGLHHTCARLEGGRVRCWGVDDSGQLGGEAHVRPPATPVEVPGVQTAHHVTGGQFHTCAELTSGRIECWGTTVAVDSLSPKIDDRTGP